MKKFFSKLNKADFGIALLFLFSAATMFLWLVGAERGFSKVAAELMDARAPAMGNVYFWLIFVLRVFIMPALFCVLSGVVPFFYWGKEKVWKAFILSVLFFCLYVLWQFTLGLDLIYHTVGLNCSVFQILCIT
ncbi:MAG: hypothetical protein ACK4PK_07560 [Alphaproteobacteria bacterium]